MVTQTAVDLIYMCELCEEDYPQVALFLCFLRELYDADALLFFLHCRELVQRSFGVRLAQRVPLLGQGAARHTARTARQRTHAPG